MRGIAGRKPAMALLARRLVTAAMAFTLAVAGVVALDRTEASAASPGLELVTYYTVSGFQGFKVDIRTTGVDDAAEVRVIVHRTSGGDVVKTSKATGSVPATINAGGWVTAPIIIVPGTYDEAASSSWNSAVGAWSPDTYPTSVEVQVRNADGAVIVSGDMGVDRFQTSAATLDDVMPKAASLNAAAAFRSDTYRGLNIDIRATNVFDAHKLRLSIEREVGGTVVKESIPTSAVAGNLNQGKSVSLPVVFVPGTYDDAASSSWRHVSGDPTWTPETRPTRFTLEALREDGSVIGTESFDLDEVATAKGDWESLKPAAPRLVGFEHIQYKVTDAYDGLSVNFEYQDFTDAESVTVAVERASGSPVTKTSKPGASFMSALNSRAFGRVTVPIIVKAKSYDEAASSSWYKAVAVWGPDSRPTRVTVTVHRRYGPDVVLQAEVPETTVYGKEVHSWSEVGPGAAPDAPIVLPVPADAPSYRVEVPAEADDVRLDLGAPEEVGGKVETTVPTEVVVSTGIGAEVTIPATTARSADPSWDGTLKLPKVVDAAIPAAEGDEVEVGLAIELGVPGMRIDFADPVRIVLAGQAGKKAGFIQGGVFHEISDECPADMPAGMTGNECRADEGDDLVIWTTHFTTFVSYTVTAPPGGGLGTDGDPDDDGGDGDRSGTGSDPGNTPKVEQPSTGGTTPDQAPTVRDGGSVTTTTTAPAETATTTAPRPSTTAPQAQPTTTPEAPATGVTAPEAAPAPDATGGGMAPILLIPLGLLLLTGAAYFVARARRA